MRAAVRHLLLRKSIFSKEMSKNGYGFACKRLCDFKDLSDLFICRCDFFSTASGKMWFTNSWYIMKTATPVSISMLSGAPFSYDYVCLKVFRELFADNIILGGLFLPPAFGWQICIGFLIGLISH